MRISPLGERAFLLSGFEGSAHEVARALNANPPAGLHEAMPSYDSVGLFVDPLTFRTESIQLLPVQESPRTTRHEIPVWYVGEDLAEAASALGITPALLVQTHSDAVYRCAAVGFRPGFAYLGDLPPAIAGLPRRAEPRLRVEAGSLGITGRQTAVYPQSSPGGWWLIGRTPLTLVDVADDYFPIQAGDEVVFKPIEEAEFRSREGERL
jgi:inhibitor of KinA